MQPIPCIFLRQCVDGPMMNEISLSCCGTEWHIDLSYSIYQKTGFISGAAFIGEEWATLCITHNIKGGEGFVLKHCEGNRFEMTILNDEEHLLQDLWHDPPMEILPPGIEPYTWRGKNTEYQLCQVYFENI